MSSTLVVKFGTFSSFFDDLVKDKDRVHRKIVRVELVDTTIVLTAIVGRCIYRKDVGVRQPSSTESPDAAQVNIVKTLDHLRHLTCDYGFEPRTGVFS